MNKDLSASEAARILGVSLATLYSYVSRGMLTPSCVQAERRKRYPHDEVLRLAARKADGKRGGHKVAAAMNWGTPVLETRISRIADGRLHYRGHDVLALAANATLEQVACLLWDDSGHDYFTAAAVEAALPAPALASIAAIATACDKLPSMPPLEAAMCMLPMHAQAIPAQADDAHGRFVTGAALMRMLAGLLLKRAPDVAPLHLQVAQAWQADAAQADWIRAALVLLADHELNASTFTVRCVAATGAIPTATASTAQVFRPLRS